MASPRSADRPGSPATLLDKLDELVPAPLAQYDAFPKIPSTYKARSESRGFFTLFVAFLAFLLVLNDLGEYIWGWPDYEFSVDPDAGNEMEVNVDVVVNMPCQCKCSAFSIDRIWTTRSVAATCYLALQGCTTYALESVSHFSCLFLSHAIQYGTLSAFV